MATEREVEEILARCVSIMVYFCSCRRSSRAEATMVFEIQAVVARMTELDLSPDRMAEEMLGAIRGELTQRYGSLVGGRLTATFGGVFRAACQPNLLAFERDMSSGAVWV